MFAQEYQAKCLPVAGQVELNASVTQYVHVRHHVELLRMRTRP